MIRRNDALIYVIKKRKKRGGRKPNDPRRGKRGGLTSPSPRKAQQPPTAQESGRKVGKDAVKGNRLRLTTATDLNEVGFNRRVTKEGQTYA